jgi:hypothetical protein
MTEIILQGNVLDIGSSISVGVEVMVYDGANWVEMRTPSKFINLNAVNIDHIAAVWTPTPNMKFRLLGGSISVSQAASVLFEDHVAGATVLRTPVISAGSSYSFQLGNTGIISFTTDNVLRATTNVPGCLLTGFLYGTEEAL